MNKRKVKGNSKICFNSNFCYYFHQFTGMCWDMNLDIHGLTWASRVCPIYRDIYFVLPSASDILRYILSCRAIAIYDLPINLRYIYKRVSPLLVMLLYHNVCQMLCDVTMYCHIMWHNETKCDNSFWPQSAAMLSQPQICFNLASLRFNIGKPKDEKSASRAQNI